MKRSGILCFLILYTSLVTGQTNLNRGIQFFKGSWEQALIEARKTDKILFVDVYTDWCGPCKYMDKFVFTEAAVGSRYNAAFVNYKIDAEKGEGKSIAGKYNVKAYPTFLFLDHKGNLVYKVAGEKEKVPFLAVAEQAINAGTDKNNLAQLESSYKAGNRNPQFLRRYLIRLSNLNMDNTGVLDEYFKTIPARLLQQDTTLLYLASQLSGKQSAALTHLMLHYNKLSMASKEKTTDRLFEKVVRNSAGLALQEKRLEEYLGFITFGKKLYGLNEKQLELLNRLDLMYGGLTGDYLTLKKAGYKMADQPFSVSSDSLRNEDKRRYNSVMKPFSSGERDSTKTPGFREEKKFLVNLYTREVTEKLYTAAKAFSQLPVTETGARADAKKWAKKCLELQPDVKLFADLVKTLEGTLP